MKFIWKTMLVVALLAGRAEAQQPFASKTISSTTCPGAGCLVVDVQGMGSAGLQITGTFVGTISFNVAQDAVNYVAVNATPNNSAIDVQSTTAPGYWTVKIPGARWLQIVFSAYTSGTAVVTTQLAQSAASYRPPFNGNSGTCLAGDGTFQTCAGGTGSGVPGGSTNTAQYNAGGGNFGGVTLNATTTPKYLRQISSAAPTLVQPQSSDLSDVAALAVVAGNLSQFAATTSAQLASVLSDETGTGAAVFGTSPTIVTPTIASFANATHSHANSAGGGQLSEPAFSFSNITTANATSSQHGLMPKGSGSATDCYLGDLTVAACPGGASYTNLFQNGANGLWERNSTTAQTFDLAGTYTSTTDFKSIQLTYGTDADSNVGVTLRNNKGSSTSTFPNLLIRAQGPADLVITEEHGSYEKSIQMLQSSSNIMICPRDANCASVDQSGGKMIMSSSSGLAFEINPNGTLQSSVMQQYAGANPTCSGCGTSPTLLGGNVAGRITVGTTPSASMVLTMPIPWTANNAACWATDETTGVTIPAVASGTATLTITGTFLATQTVAYGCLAIQ